MLLVGLASKGEVKKVCKHVERYHGVFCATLAEVPLDATSSKSACMGSVGNFQEVGAFASKGRRVKPKCHK